MPQYPDLKNKDLPRQTQLIICSINYSAIQFLISFLDKKMFVITLLQLN